MLFGATDLTAQEIKPKHIKGKWRLLYKEVDGKAIYSMARRYTTGGNQLKRGVHRDTSAIYTFAIIERERKMLIQHEDGYGQLKRTEMDITGKWRADKTDDIWLLTMSDLYFVGSEPQVYAIEQLGDGMLKLKETFSGTTLVFRRYSAK